MYCILSNIIPNYTVGHIFLNDGLIRNINFCRITKFLKNIITVLLLWFLYVIFVYEIIIIIISIIILWY